MNRAKTNLLEIELQKALVKHVPNARVILAPALPQNADLGALDSLKSPDNQNAIFLSSTQTLGTRAGTLFEKDIAELAHPKARRQSPFDLHEILALLHTRLANAERNACHADKENARRKNARVALDKKREPLTLLEDEIKKRRDQDITSAVYESLQSFGARYAIFGAEATWTWLCEHVLRAAHQNARIVRLAPLGQSRATPFAHPLAFEHAARFGNVHTDGDAQIDLMPFDDALAQLVHLARKVTAGDESLPKVFHLSSADRAPLSGARFLELLDLHHQKNERSLFHKSRAGVAPTALEHDAILNEDTRMRARNIERIGAPKLDIDWRRYLLDVHLKDAASREPSLEEAEHKQAYGNLIELLEQSCARHGRAFAFKHLYDDESPALTFRYDEVITRAKAVAERLYRAGIEPGDRVLLSAKNHPHWPIAFFGIVLRGAVCVPLDPALDDDAVTLIVKSAEPKLALFDKDADASFSPALEREEVQVMRLKMACAKGNENESFALSAHDVEGDAVVSILYTSGTTGVPKGVMLTHQNFTQLLASLSSIFEMHDDERLLSVLPLHHTFEFSCGFLLPFVAGGCINSLETIEGETLLRALKNESITAMVGVPALWQLLARRIETQANENEWRGRLFALLRKSNVYLQERLPEKAKGLQQKGEALLFRQIHNALGGSMRTLISGGSALAPDTASLFRDIGLPLYEGYGLTEAAPVLTVATSADPVGSVGKTIPGVVLKIENPDEQGRGEVWAKGPNVMRGYYQNEEATSQVMHEGWLRTGDLGVLNEGTLTLTGRMKDVVVSASGENIYLDDTEVRIQRALPQEHEIEFSLIGDARGSEEELVLVYIGLEEADTEALLKNACKALPSFARPRAYLRYDLDETLPKTSTRKVKRKSLQVWAQKARVQKAQVQADTRSPEASVSAHRALKAVKEVTGQSEVAIDSRFDDLGFDSLMWVELQSVIDKNENRLLDALALADLERVSDLANMISKVSEPSNQKNISERLPAPQAAAPEALLRSTLTSAVKLPLRSALALSQHELFARYFNTVVSGKRHIPQNESVIVIANHTSHLDTGLVKFALGDYGKRLRPLAAKDYFFEGHPLKTGFFKHLTNLAPIDRKSGSGRAFEQAKALVDAGEVILIYPEGTRQTTGRLADFKPLVARLAMQTQRKVLPLYLEGAFEALPKGARKLRQVPLSVRIGAPISPEELAQVSSHLHKSEQARAATTLLLERVRELRDPKEGATVQGAKAARA